MTDVELLPLPPSPLVQMSWDGPGAEVRHTTVYTADQMQAYARANVEHHTATLQAENERLRAEVELWRHKAAIHKYRRKRLAEALRDAWRALAFEAQHLPECNEPYERANRALAQEDRND